MRIEDLTPEEKKEIKKAGRRCDCHLTKPDTCERCITRAVRELLRPKKP